MKIFVNTIYNFMDMLGNKKSQTLEFPADTAVATVLDKLCQIYGDALKEEMFDESGNFTSNIIIFLNGRNILTISGVDTKLNENDILLLFPPALGG